MENVMRQPGAILLVSCYELGHQPAGVAMPLAFLHRAGYSASSLDVSVEGFDEERARRARFAGISVPMHTALRLGLKVAEAIRRINPSCHICFYGLYASLNAGYLLDRVADSCIGGEFEGPLVALIRSLEGGLAGPVEGVATRVKAALPVLARLDFPVPLRNNLPPLEHYARLEHRGEQRLVGYVEASRGCLHHCTHCPIPPVYKGRFFAIPREGVIEDIRRLVEAGAQHVTFGDPDFLNGPTHSLKLVRQVSREFPGLTFDFTAKVEHIIKHRDLIPEFARSGCVFVVSALESLSDAVLARLEKGHTRRDILEALQILGDAGITLRPSFVSFTPWTTIDDFIDVLEFVGAEGLIDHVDPVQYSIRLLVPPGSLLLSAPDVNEWLGPLAEDQFSYRWSHADPRMDQLHGQVSSLVEQAARRNEDASRTFYRICELAYRARGDRVNMSLAKSLSPLRSRPPRLTEAWFC